MQGALTIRKVDKTQLIYSVSYFNFWGLVALFGGLSPPTSPRGDGTGLEVAVRCFYILDLRYSLCCNLIQTLSIYRYGVFLGNFKLLGDFGNIWTLHHRLSK